LSKVHAVEQAVLLDEAFAQRAPPASQAPGSQ